MKGDLKSILAPIRLLAFDVDGVLTNGKLYYGVSIYHGDYMKVFDVKDGLGIRTMISKGYQVALITAGESLYVDQRAEDLGIQHVFKGVLDKLPVLMGLIEKLHIKLEEVAYMGDDWIDLPILEKVGCAACPSDAVPCVQAACSFISQHTGGNGAVRELCDAVLEAQRPCAD